MKAQEGENNVNIGGAERAPTRRNKDFTVDVESQRPARTMGGNTQVVKNRVSESPVGLKSRICDQASLSNCAQTSCLPSGRLLLYPELESRYGPERKRRLGISGRTGRQRNGLGEVERACSRV